MAFNSQSLAKTQEYLERMQTRMAKVRQHAETSMGQAIQSAEVTGTAFAFSYANQRWGGEAGEIKVLGLPIDLGIGFALTGLALMGGLGKYTEHGVNIGSGALASYAVRSGAQLGLQAASDGPAPASFRQPAARMGGAPVNVGWDGHPYVAATVEERTR